MYHIKILQVSLDIVCPAEAPFLCAAFELFACGRVRYMKVKQEVSERSPEVSARVISHVRRCGCDAAFRFPPAVDIFQFLQRRIQASEETTTQYICAIRII